jgi:ribonuclease HI
MTNNKAEYLGLIAGLQAARDNSWQVEVVGDSSLILRQVREYRPPRSPGLRPLYSTARRLADAVRVRVWQHHVRAYNKMADCAANVAMDTQASARVHHPSERPHTATIESHLRGDFDEWRTRHFLRNSRD